MIEENFLYANQLFQAGVKEYMDGLRHSREKNGMNMGQQLHEKLEGILVEGHSNRIKKLKVRLNKADKVDEKKVHFKILELVSRYE